MKHCFIFTIFTLCLYALDSSIQTDWEGVWEGVWEGRKNIPLSLHTCVDKWSLTGGVYYRDYTSVLQPAFKINGIINSTDVLKKNWEIGNNSPGKIELVSRTFNYQWPQSEIILISGNILNISIPTNIQTIYIQDSYNNTLFSQNVTGLYSVSWKTPQLLTPYVKVMAIIKDTNNTVFGGYIDVISVSSDFTLSLTQINMKMLPQFLSSSRLIEYDFSPISGSTSAALCNDKKGVWVGSWEVQLTINSDVQTFYWWVCKDPSTNILKASFGTLPLTRHYYSTDIQITDSLYATVEDMTGSSNMTFELYISDDNNQFYGNGILVNTTSTYNITLNNGLLISSIPPIPLYCSPVLAYTGVWTELKTDSTLYVCSDGLQVLGYYQVQSCILSGYLVFNPDLNDYVLQATVSNTITNVITHGQFYIDPSTKDLSIIYKLSGQTLLGMSLDPWATLSSRTSGICSPPLISGSWFEYQYSSTLYVCISDRNTIYGSFNNGLSKFNATIKDLTAFGTIQNPEGTTKFECNFPTYTNITEIHIDNFGFEISTVVYKLSDSATLSQCAAQVLLSAYVGSWNTNNGDIINICTIGNKVYGKIFPNLGSTILLEGNYTNQYLIGIYREENQEPNVNNTWYAITTLEENIMVLTLNNGTQANISFNAVHQSKQMDGYSCSWEFFWGNRYGSNGVYNNGDSMSYWTSGCFSVCLKENSKFTIIFYIAEIFGQGVIYDNGTLIGQIDIPFLKTSYNFQMDVIPTGISAVYWNSTTRYHTSYVPCLNLVNYTDMNSIINTCSSEPFSPTIQLKINNFVSAYPSASSSHPSIDISYNGTLAIISDSKTISLLQNNNKTWTHISTIQQTDVVDSSISKTELFQYTQGNRIAITNNNIYYLSNDKVVKSPLQSQYSLTTYLNPPKNCTLCYPLYIIKDFVLTNTTILVLWGDFSEDTSMGGGTAYPTLYYADSNLYDPIWSVSGTGILATSICEKWIAYSQLLQYSSQTQVNIYVYSKDKILNGVTYLPSTLSIPVTIDSTFGFGFSLAIENTKLLVGNPASVGNWGGSTGSVFYWKYIEPGWYLKQTIQAPDGGYHQSFGRSLAIRDDVLVIQKGHDYTVVPASNALFVYQYDNDTWSPVAKFISPSWPGVWMSINRSSKRQFIESSPIEEFSEALLPWAISGLGPMIITTQDLAFTSLAWYSCPLGYWGNDCDIPCDCNNGSCNGNIVGFKCDCPDNNFGQTCDQICPPCIDGVCNNGNNGTGHCVCNNNNTYGPLCAPCTCQYDEYCNNGYDGDGHCNQCPLSYYGSDCNNTCYCVYGVCDEGVNGTGKCYCFPNYNGPNCTALYSDNSISSSELAGGIVGGLLALIIIIIIIFYFIWKTKNWSLDINALPEEVRWYLDENRIRNEMGWEERGSYLCKDIIKEKKYMKRLRDLLDNHLQGTKISIQKAYAIYNKTLINNFLGLRTVISTRYKTSPGLFKSEAWKEIKGGDEKREWVYKNYINLVNSYSWNKDLELPIIPVVHGTDATVGNSICAGGFAALSTLDAGFYGKGIYFTSSCLYAIPYYAIKPTPTILVCFIIPGNTRPVIENYTDKNCSLLGKPITSGYQSHYVCCNSEGHPCPEICDNFFDEIVIPQESQVIPIFLVHVNKDCLEELVQTFQRVTVYENMEKDGKLTEKQENLIEEEQEQTTNTDSNNRLHIPTPPQIDRMIDF